MNKFWKFLETCARVICWAGIWTFLLKTLFYDVSSVTVNDLGLGLTSLIALTLFLKPRVTFVIIDKRNKQ